MPYKPADYAPDETHLLTNHQKRRELGRWLSSRTPEDTERYRLDKKQEDRESTELDNSRRESETNRENREEQEVEHEKQWNRNLRSATRFREAKSSEKIQAHLKLEQEAERKANEKERTRRMEARITKFKAMVKAEADRWTEELELSNAARDYPDDETPEGRLGFVHDMAASHKPILPPPDINCVQIVGTMKIKEGYNYKKGGRWRGDEVNGKLSAIPVGHYAGHSGGYLMYFQT